MQAVTAALIQKAEQHYLIGNNAERVGKKLCVPRLFNSAQGALTFRCYQHKNAAKQQPGTKAFDVLLILRSSQTATVDAEIRPCRKQAPLKGMYLPAEL